MTVVASRKRESVALGPALAAETSRNEFREAAALHRGGLLAHCYRFTGSLHDAEDLVQETFLRAWRTIDRFERRSSLRNWLYRIATNVCLTALERRAGARRVLPNDIGHATTRMPEGPPAMDTPWIEPLPDSMLEGLRDTSPGPAVRYELRETVRLAFIAATQRLPGRQRAVFLLRDVLGWSASETASALQVSVATVTSALQRARGTLGKTISPEEIAASEENEAQTRSIGNAFASAWERADLDGLVTLLAKDATLVMPPRSEWYAGRIAIRGFLGWAFDWAWNTGAHGSFRLLATRANGELAFGTYVRDRGYDRAARFEARCLQVLSLQHGRIQRLTGFVGAQYFERFSLPAALPHP